MPPLPPGPTLLSPLGPLLLLAWTSFNIEPITLAAKYWYGSVFTLYLLPSSPVILVADRAVTHRVLVQSGAAFADRPPTNLPTAVFNGDRRTITTAAYGPLWRALRRNLTGGALHPSSLRRYAAVRADACKQQRWWGSGRPRASAPRRLPRVLQDVLRRHRRRRRGVHHRAAEGVPVVGGRVPGAWRVPAGDQAPVPAPVEAHDVAPAAAGEALRPSDTSTPDCYVDTDGGRNLTESEMVSLCSEFLSGGPDSTVTAMQWTMANLVVQREVVQAKLRAEINGIVAGEGGHVGEAHLPEMPYLKVVVLEGLRRHPPGRFMLPHAAAAAEVTIGGFSVPRHAAVNFTLGGMAMDAAVWRDPERFRPERFLPGGEGDGVDLTGRKEIKMMPFGAGRRICPGIEASLLHLEYFVASMVAAFEWREVPGEAVGLAEKLELTMVMRRQLRAIVVPCH
ncbi:unnamed protein product [Urochloa decumbens]|uniref:Uncharacterized protein n=1 Tax=Urochloa decumbens TaxID=240449 RepID=A0ABC8WBY8_9POAL